MFVMWILIYIAIALAAWLTFWMLVTFLVGKGRRQGEFIAGHAPAAPPEGFYDGTAYLLGGWPVPWLGKSFDSANDIGFNIFTPFGASVLRGMTPFYRRFRSNRDGSTQAYDFKTSTGPGFRDKNIEVFKLDYASPENPFMIRIILDEMVETADGEFLGKVHMKVFPGYFATIGFFGLKRSANHDI